MTKKNTKNYKLSCVGIDSAGLSARLQFCVYDVKTIAEAREEVRKDKLHRKVMRRNNIDYKTVELRAVRCNNDGEVEKNNMKKERRIVDAESAEIRHMYFEKRCRMHPWLNLTEI